MRESAFLSHLKLKLAEAGLRAGHPVHWNRVENLARRSMPDVFAQWATFDFWLEAKVAHGLQVKYQPGQPHWLERQWKARQNAFTIVAKARGVHFDVYLYRGDQSMELAGGGLRYVVPELLVPAAQWRTDGPDLILKRVTWGGCPDSCRCTEGVALG